MAELRKSLDGEQTGGESMQVKAGRHREATLYHALHGAGAGDGRSLEQLRQDARAAYERLELPVWRRSGFWTTTLQDLDLEALEPFDQGPGAGTAAAAGAPRRSSPARCPSARGRGAWCRARTGS